MLFNKETTLEDPGASRPKSSLPFLVNSMLTIENTRIRTQVRQTHLKLRNIVDPRTDQVLELLESAEEQINGWVAEELKIHPAYPWFSRIKGIGDENIAKVVGMIDIRKAPTISSLWKYAGLHVVKIEVSREKRIEEINDSLDGLQKKLEDLRKKAKREEDESAAAMTPAVIGDLMATIGTSLNLEILPITRGQAPRREKGEKLAYNSKLRVMCFRLANSFLKARGKYAQFYNSEKRNLISKYKDRGIHIIPTLELTKKDGKFFEPVGVISENHVHMQAMRKMEKLFLSHLWVVWRRAEGLSVTEPYAYSVLGHTKHDYISPEDMIEKPEKTASSKRRARRAEVVILSREEKETQRSTAIA